MLFTKYLPKSINEIPQKITELVKLIKKNKKIIIYGPSGTGKTTSAYIIANELNYEVLEINSSDNRSKKNLEKYIPAVKQKSIFGKNKIILIDDVDGLSNLDRSGLKGIIELIKESIFPIIITANDIWDQKYKSLRKMCHLIEFQPIPSSIIKQKLLSITKDQNISLNHKLEQSITQISESSKGDLRAAINDLEAILFSKNQTTEALSRELEQKLKLSLKIIFTNNHFNNLIHALYSLDTTPEDVIYWIEHNLWKHKFSKQTIINILKNINNANKLLYFIKQNQYWRILIYYYFYLSVGIGYQIPKKNETLKSKQEIKYSEPNLFLKKWIGKNKNAIKNSIIIKLAKLTNSNSKRIRELFKNYMIILNKELINNQSQKNHNTEEQNQHSQAQIQLINILDLDNKQKEYIKKNKQMNK